MGRTACTTCEEPGCDRSPANGDVLYRANPKGEKGIFLCKEHEAETWGPAAIVRVLDGWSDNQRKEIEELAAVIEKTSENDDWEWCLGDAEAIFKAGYRRVCGPVDQPF